VAELQDKLVTFPVTAAVSRGDGGQGAALEALMALGYPGLDARRALDAAVGADGTEALVRAALQILDEAPRGGGPR
jgi:hypothetical protein